MALQTSAGFAALKGVIEWMRQPLQYGVFRVNTLRMSPETVLDETRSFLDETASRLGRKTPSVHLHPVLSEAVITSSWPGVKPILEPLPGNANLPVVIVDGTCGNAVLRGSPVFKGGVLGISEGIKVGDMVNIQVFREGFKSWIGHGVLRSIPSQHCSEKLEKGDTKFDCVVEMISGMSVIPPVCRTLVESGAVCPQSLPAITVSRVLDPRPGERILDFGAGTGTMSTHIAALTSNQADIVAVDHSRQRLSTLVERCKLFGAKVKPVCADVEDFAKQQKCGFDRILVHPDHSSYGVRPSIIELVGRGRGVNIKSRQFVEKAVDLLKPNGRLVYCTGSLMPLENEAVIRWLLDRRSDLKLEAAEPRISPVGVKCPIPTPSWMTLSPDEEKLIQRFGPGTSDLVSDPVDSDVPSFFIACITKIQ